MLTVVLCHLSDLVDHLEIIKSQNSWCTDTSAVRHFGSRTFRQQRNTAEVSGHFGSTADVSYGLFGSAAEVSREVFVCVMC